MSGHPTDARRLRDSNHLLAVAATLASFPTLLALGVFAASLVGLSVGVPMNRRVSDRLDQYCA